MKLGAQVTGDLDHVANYGVDGSGLIRLSGVTT